MISIEDARDQKEMAKAIEVMVNGSRGYDEFTDQAMTMHRTLQQMFTNLCFEWIRSMAAKSETGQYDARNEYSVNKCKEFVDSQQESILYDGPLI